MIGLQIGRPIRTDRRGQWYLAQRPRGAQDVGPGEALVFQYGGGTAEPHAVPFVRERGRLAERMEPPFARVLGRTEDPPRIAVELVRAVPARRLIDAGVPVTLDRALAIARAVCAAATTLREHAAGAPVPMIGGVDGAEGWWLTERDVRFSNPWLRGIGGPSTGDPIVAAVAILDHLSPEALFALPHAPEADCWMIAAVTVSLLRGRPRYQGSFEEVLRSVGDPSPDPLEELAEVPAIRAALARALQPDPKDRPADSRALGRALHEAMRSDGVPRSPLDLGDTLDGFPREICVPTA